MAKKCEIYNKIVLYLDCLECEDKLCKHFEDKEQEKEPVKDKE